MRTARVPAMANAHSHAFQLDLRGIGERVGGPGAGDDFWSWRTEMYRLAARPDPESMGAVGARVYRAMAAAGYRAVGEFHYVVHQPDGTPYPEPNAMAIALAQAAVGAGLEIVLLPAAYARGGFQVELAEGQRRFVDPDVDVFLERLDDLRAWAQDQPGVAVGVAVHSVRAVPAEWIEAVGRYAQEHDLVRHVHASEQVRELDECWSEHGCSPVELLADCGYLSPRTSVVHGIHVSDRDISLLAESNSIVVTCPTTEGNLGDGIFPGPRYREAGVRIAIGTDSQVRIDPFEELREMETLARRQGQTRDALLAVADGDLWGAVRRAGRESLGLDPSRGGGIEIDLDHPDLAGVADEDLSLALATCASAAVVVRQR